MSHYRKAFARSLKEEGQEGRRTGGRHLQEPERSFHLTAGLVGKAAL